MSKDRIKPFKSVAVVGAAGRTGELFVRTLAPVTNVNAVIRRTDRQFPQGVSIARNMRDALSQSPEAVIFAVQNPINEALQEFAEAVELSKKSPTVILPPNGVDAVPAALEVLGAYPQIPIVDASLYTMVVRDRRNNPNYRKDKRRIALSPARRADYRYFKDEDEALEKAVALFKAGDFDVAVEQDFMSMDWSKLVSGNLFGSTADITWLSPEETFNDPKLFALEKRAVLDRFRIMEAAGIPFDGLWGARFLPFVPNLPGFVRGIVANQAGEARNHQPPAAAEQLKQGVKHPESQKYYHKPIIDLGKQYGLRSPVDEAIVEIIKTNALEREINLQSMNMAERKRLLLEVTELERTRVFLGSSPFVTPITEGATRLFTRSLEIKGTPHVYEILACLKRGESVLLAADHLSHADHTTIVMAIKDILGEEFHKYPLNIVAGLLFENDFLTRLLNRTYPHFTVATLNEGATAEEKWKAQIMNRRSGVVTQEALSKPSVFLVYLEGTRRRTDGLQKAKPGGSGYVMHPNVTKVAPIAVRKTQTIMRPGNGIPRFGEASVEFGQLIDAKKLREEATQLPKNERDEFITGRIMREIALMLPKEEKGAYA